MDENGFDFTPVRKDPPRRFEPPPWEREAFERLERDRLASAEADKAAVARTAPEPHDEVWAERHPAPVARAAAEGEGPRGAKADAAGALSEARMLEMLSALAEQEPAEPRGLFAVGVGAGLVLVAIGGVLIVWAMAALVGSAQTGWMGQVSGAGIGIFGVFFLGVGVWMMYRTLKRRGVL